MANDIDPEYRKRLVQKIHTAFETTVLPLNVLYVFQKYDPNVLTAKDIDQIKTCCNNKGNIEGASLLLDFLSRYAGWFKCLLSVLQDPNVKQAFLANQLQAMKDELDQELLTKKYLKEPLPQQESFWAERRPPISELSPSNPSMSLEHDSPTVNTRSNDNYIDPVDPDYSQTVRGAEALDEGAGLALNRSLSEGGFPALAGGRALDKKVKVVSDIPERNFTEKEVVDAIGGFSGWHPDIEDREVLHLLKRNVGTPGQYILWFWRNKKRPAICVTHDGEVKTLIVHKRPDSRDPKKVDYYFINKAEKICKTLEDIVQFHLDNGVEDLSKKPSHVKIMFKNPIL
ncbi:tyrosine-protein kinase Fer [Biomphalaria glabrata]|nr:tyrosine-protein kinase Fer [Biomphalaria glabrata]